MDLILQAVHPLITFDGGGGKTVVLPPCSNAGGNGQAGGHELVPPPNFRWAAGASRLRSKPDLPERTPERPCGPA